MFLKYLCCIDSSKGSQDYWRCDSGIWATCDSSRRLMSWCDHVFSHSLPDMYSICVCSSLLPLFISVHVPFLVSYVQRRTELKLISLSGKQLTSTPLCRLICMCYHYLSEANWWWRLFLMCACAAHLQTISQAPYWGCFPVVAEASRAAGELRLQEQHTC